MHSTRGMALVIHSMVVSDRYEVPVTSYQGSRQGGAGFTLLAPRCSICCTLQKSTHTDSKYFVPKLVDAVLKGDLQVPRATYDIISMLVRGTSWYTTKSTI